MKMDSRDTSFPVASKAQIVRRAHAEYARPEDLPRLHDMLGKGPFAQVFLFISGDADFAAIIRAARAEFGETPVNACTTAGEIAPEGYSEGSIVAVALPASHFAVRTIFVDNLSEVDQEDLIGRFIRYRRDLASCHPNWSSEFAFLMVDGLSTREEALLQALTPVLGGIPLFGGSAGDAGRFEHTWISCQGQIRENAAVVTLVRTRCRTQVFSLDHFAPAEHFMVVTKADPSRRTVSEINAEPAVNEYARALGIAPEQVSPSTYASNPLAVRVGDTHHVRGILQSEEDGTLEFAAAIDVGLVMHLAVGGDIESHLSRKLALLSDDIKPDVILACDCMWRKIEISDQQATRAVSKILSKNNVLGFNTYGEQIDSLHVNHTMTGVAIYPPDDGETDAETAKDVSRAWRSQPDR